MTKRSNQKWKFIPFIWQLENLAQKLFSCIKGIIMAKHNSVIVYKILPKFREQCCTVLFLPHRTAVSLNDFIYVKHLLLLMITWFREFRRILYEGNRYLCSFIYQCIYFLFYFFASYTSGYSSIFASLMTR